MNHCRSIQHRIMRQSHLCAIIAILRAIRGVFRRVAAGFYIITVNHDCIYDVNNLFALNPIIMQHYSSYITGNDYSYGLIIYINNVNHALGVLP
jgi:hypothetical protein